MLRYENNKMEITIIGEKDLNFKKSIFVYVVLNQVQIVTYPIVTSHICIIINVYLTN